MHFNATIEMGNLPSLDERMDAIIHQTLVRRMAEAAGEIITAARAKLQVKPDDVTTPDGNIYGYDTGLMYNSLTALLVDTYSLEMKRVAYDLAAPDAPYWQFVEFGHMLRNGGWWPGYHFLSSTVAEKESIDPPEGARGVGGRGHRARSAGPGGWHRGARQPAQHA